jgi:hypothetical protein
MTLENYKQALAASEDEAGMTDTFADSPLSIAKL